jgi:hypothetical protein
VTVVQRFFGDWEMLEPAAGRTGREAEAAYYWAGIPRKP